MLKKNMNTLWLSSYAYTVRSATAQHSLGDAWDHSNFDSKVGLNDERIISKLLYYVFILFTVLCPAISHATQNGIVIVPVADLVADPIGRLFPGHTPTHAYNNLPWSCYQSHYGANGRLHQLLLHERVAILSSTKHEVCIEVPHVYYITRAITQPQTRYWTLKKNILPLSDYVSQKVPPPIRFLHPESVYNPRVVHLLQPWYAAELGVTLSAGTRFSAKSIESDTVTVYAIHPSRGTITTLSLPRSFIHMQAKNTDERIQNFVNICKQWAHASDGSIAYTLGGCSYIQTHAHNHFTRAKSSLTSVLLHHYEREENPAIKTGLDCSSLILRAAQIAGLPYFYKNTHTVEQKLRGIAFGEPIETGDIIWMPGHVLVISDAQKGLCIEAHSYDGGYGIVHELPLEQVFKGVTSCSALMHAVRNKKSLYRLHKNGTIQQVHSCVNILKIRSLFI